MKKRAFFAFLIILIGATYYVKNMLEERAFLEKIRLENIEIASEIKEIGGEKQEKISEHEKESSYKLGNTKKFMNYVALYEPYNFVETYLKVNPPEQKTLDSRRTTQSEKEAARQKNIANMESRKKEAKEKLNKKTKNQHRLFTPNHFKQRLVISFSPSHVGDVTTLRVTDVDPLDKIDENFPYSIRYFSRHNWIAESLDRCHRTHQRRNNPRCRYSVNYSFSHWKVPSTIGRRIDPETFKMYAKAYFSKSQSKIGRSITGLGLANVSRNKYFHATCKQIDIYDDKEFSNLINSIGCERLNRFIESRENI